MAGSGVVAPLRAPLRGVGKKPAGLEGVAAARAAAGPVATAPAAVGPKKGPPAPAPMAAKSGGGPSSFGAAGADELNKKAREAALAALGSAAGGAGVAAGNAKMPPKGGPPAMVADDGANAKGDMGNGMASDGWRPWQAAGGPYNAAEAAENSKVKSDLKLTDENDNPGPGYAWDPGAGRWAPVPMPVGVSADDPGWVYSKEAGWVYDKNAAMGEDIRGKLLETMNGDASEFGLSEEELAGQHGKIDRAAAASKAAVANAMANRGLGASGLVGTGFGEEDANAMSQHSDLDYKNELTGIEARLKELQTLASTYGAQLSEEQRKSIADAIQELEQQKQDHSETAEDEGDNYTILHDALADLGGERWDPQVKAWALEQLESGVPADDVLAALAVKGSDKVLGFLDGAEPEGWDEPGGDGAEEEAAEGPAPEWSDLEGDGWKSLYEDYVAAQKKAGKKAMSAQEWRAWHENDLKNRDAENAGGLG